MGGIRREEGKRPLYREKLIVFLPVVKEMGVLSSWKPPITLASFQVFLDAFELMLFRQRKLTSGESTICTYEIIYKIVVCITISVLSPTCPHRSRHGAMRLPMRLG